MNPIQAIPNGLKHIWIWLVEDTVWCEGIDVYLEAMSEVIEFSDKFNTLGKFTLYIICFLFVLVFRSMVFIGWTCICIPCAIAYYVIGGLLTLGELFFIKKTKR